MLKVDNIIPFGERAYAQSAFWVTVLSTGPRAQTKEREAQMKPADSFAGPLYHPPRRESCAIFSDR
ncbi:hypothetical protein SDJN02_03087, partial [Cucurbita argyrosperma subsp. argyrosperma]